MLVRFFSGINKTFYVFLTAVIIFGLLLRLDGVDFGLPFIYDPDEPDFVVPAFKILATRDPNPHWFGHPGTFTIYSMTLTFGLYGLIGLLTGHFSDVSSIGMVFWHNPSIFYLLGRIVIACFGAGTLLMLYAASRRVSSRWESLLAVSILTISPLHIEYSSIIRTDIQQTFLLVTMSIFALEIAKYGRWRDYLLSGLFLGFAIATKYPSVVFATAIIIAWIVDSTGERKGWLIRSPRLIGAGVASIIGAFLVSPYLFIDFHTALENIAHEARQTHLSHTNPGFFSAFGYYLQEPLAQSLSVFGLLLSIVGVVVLCRRYSGVGLVLVGPSLIYMIFISSLNLIWARWVIPLLPFFSIFTAVGFCHLTDYAYKRYPVFKCYYIIGLALPILLIPTLIKTINLTEEYANNDTRTEAFEWVFRNIPAGSRVLVERYTPYLENGKYQVFKVSSSGVIEKINSKQKFIGSTGIFGELHDLNDLSRNDIDYIFFGTDYDRRLAEYGPDSKAVTPYVYIINSQQLIYRIDPVPAHQRGSSVKIYKINHK